MSAAPRPRPRHRTRQANTKNEEFSAGPSSASPSKTSIDDEDSLFIRNRNRSATGWKAINMAVEKSEKLRRSRSPSKGQSSDPEDDNPNSPSRHKKRKEKERLPEWTREKPANVIQISSDEEERDDLYIVDSPKTRPTEKTRRMVERSRSRSLTPPPPASVAQIQNTRQIITQIMGDPHIRPPSPPIEIEDDGDVVELDPVLAKIHAQIRARSPQAAQAKDYTSSNVVVSIRVKWIPHPEDRNGREIRIGPILVKRSEPFFELFAEIADHAGILLDDVVITHNGIKVFAASCAATLSIWSEAEFEACTISTYEYNKERHFARVVSSAENTTHAQIDPGAKTDALADLPDSGADSEDNNSRQGSQAPGEKFKLQLRSGTHSFPVVVRSTTKYRAIIAAFVRKADLPVSAGNTAWIVDEEGKRMHPDAEIGDEFEDGDLVDILGI